MLYLMYVNFSITSICDMVYVCEQESSSECQRAISTGVSLEDLFL